MNQGRRKKGEGKGANTGVCYDSMIDNDNFDLPHKCLPL